MEIHEGYSSLSAFRAQKLLQRLQKIDSKITHVAGQYVHFADMEGRLTKGDSARLSELLTYGQAEKISKKGALYLVVPRPGTISPWSSKATDIVHNSGLRHIRRVERGIAYYLTGATAQNKQVAGVLHDRMTEAILDDLDKAEILFKAEKPGKLQYIDMLDQGKDSLVKANRDLGLALAHDEINYLYDSYAALGRNPTDVELMMFAQVNSEHCRHKVFNADWVIDGRAQPKSLFKMIKNTYVQGGQDVLSAYHDNAAVLKGPEAGRWFSNPETGEYAYHQEPVHTVIKVETHNHPTAISPIPGAATGIGGEIRDEAATGRGAKSKMGLAGFSVSNLEIPGAERAWEQPYGKPERIVSALDIMLEGPIGGAGFANEFGRPNLVGYFRTYQQSVNGEVRGYHKPIMIAGGLGNIREQHIEKLRLPVGALVIQLGGPAMLIGLGGSTAASMQAGASEEDLDFASVQRGNGEIERRAQEVIDACWALGATNPILTIHDVGAGGLSNALPELVHDSRRGAIFQLRDIPSAEPGLTPLELWCNESQERYVLGILPEDLGRFQEICERERCPFSVVGVITDKERLIVEDKLFKNKPIDLPMEVLFGKPPKMSREISAAAAKNEPLDLATTDIEDAVKRVLLLPAVSSKKFLITIGDRTVGGLVTRDQMVGPWQAPVSDVAVTAVAFDSQAGEAMAVGERTPLALINAPAAARMAIGEAVTNIVASDVRQLTDIKLSANWMAAVGYANEDQALFESVKTVGEEFCPALGLTIPVGKDSLSMRTTWQDKGQDKSVTAPVSLIITGFSPVADVANTLTPELKNDEDTALMLIDLGEGKNRLGGSALAQVYNQLGDETPDVDPGELKRFFRAITKLKGEGKILAYHDRSDGGLLATVLEMAFASRSGLDLNLDRLNGSTAEKLFSEELGAVIQIAAKDIERVTKAFGPRLATVIGKPVKKQTITIIDDDYVYRSTRAALEQLWADTSYQIQKLRDNPEAADQEFTAITDDKDPGLSSKFEFSLKSKIYKTRPKVAIFREQGVNGQLEMAAAFDRAGFTSVDVHLHDIAAGKVRLEDFTGLAACGGFSYGDVLGAGEGWAKSILFNPRLRAEFKEFFARPDTFSLGVCNGCQMLAALKSLIPGAETWPTFLKNNSEQFEARVVMTEVQDSPSILFKGMTGARLPVPVAHGEGRTGFASAKDAAAAKSGKLVALQYIDNYGKVTEKYPYNPNGSPEGITALTTPDGRATVLMPHPERAFMTRQLSWHPENWDEMSPWFKLFQNARDWVG